MASAFENVIKQCLQEPDFMEDEGIYDDLNLEEEEELYAIGTDDYLGQHDCMITGYVG